VFGAGLTSWRFMAGRMVVWNLVGLLIPLAALPFVLRKSEGQAWRGRLAFFALWTGFCFLFQLLVHIAAPDHALMTIPALCVLGGVALARLRAAPALAVAALALNALLFLYPYRPPDPGSPPKGASLLRSARDAVYYGTVEASYRVVLGTHLLAQRTLGNLAYVAQVDPPPVLVWKEARFGWRRTVFYLPRVSAPGATVVVLRDIQHVEAHEPVAEWWEGGRLVRRVRGPRIHVALPAHRRIVWMVRPNTDFAANLAGHLPVKSWGNLFYTDPAPLARSFSAGDFIFDITPERQP